MSIELCYTHTQIVDIIGIYLVFLTFLIMFCAINNERLNGTSINSWGFISDKVEQVFLNHLISRTFLFPQRKRGGTNCLIRMFDWQIFAQRS